jgi:nicotinate-nucleotide--dimethylbenzimidazole phosphoribosyltransferase
LNASAAWWETPAAETDSAARGAAEARQGILTKPPGALGRLESVAIQLAAMQGCERPLLDAVEIVVYAADHGVVAEGVSAFPQVVTYEMVKNFANGGAAINVLARQLDARLMVVNLGTVVEADELPGVYNRPIAAGTANFARQPAMTRAQFDAALQVGRDMVEQGMARGMQLYVGGEMGIGNTTSAAAIGCALLGVDAGVMAGPGTGLDADGVSHKARVIEAALKLHGSTADSPAEVLRCFGGFEIAALAGSYIRCAQAGIPVLVDGFISTSAALCATRICAGVERWLLYSHASAEPGHATLLQALDAEPLLDLGMRLGEGSGAAVAVALLRQACALHNDMATFAEAGVSGS